MVCVKDSGMGEKVEIEKGECTAGCTDVCISRCTDGYTGGSMAGVCTRFWYGGKGGNRYRNGTVGFRGDLRRKRSQPFAEKKTSLLHFKIPFNYITKIDAFCTGLSLFFPFFLGEREKKITFLYVLCILCKR